MWMILGTRNSGSYRVVSSVGGKHPSFTGNIFTDGFFVTVNVSETLLSTEMPFSSKTLYFRNGSSANQGILKNETIHNTESYETCEKNRWFRIKLSKLFKWPLFCWKGGKRKILLMAEILHHLGCIKTLQIMG